MTASYKCVETYSCRVCIILIYSGACIMLLKEFFCLWYLSIRTVKRHKKRK